jgi:hypothetical protein
MRGTAMADLEDLAARVTALEMERDLSAVPSSWPSLTEAEKAGFTEALAEARERNRYRILNAPLNPDEVRQLLRECVTVVKPGETLVVRVPVSTPPHVVRELQELADYAQQEGMPFPVLIVVGDELGIAEAPGAG